MPGQHKRFSSSALFRTLGCPGSLLLIESIPERERESGDTIYSRRGTATHTVSEMIIADYKATGELRDANDFLGQKVNGVVIDEALVSIANDYITYCINRIEYDLADDFHPELKLDLEVWGPMLDARINGADVGGTMDFIGLWFYEREIEIADLKTGNTIHEPWEPQPLSYALCALIEYGVENFDRVRTTIVQPPPYHEKGPIRSKVYTVDEVLKWGEETLIPGIKLALTPDAPFYPEEPEVCHYCAAAGRCTARKEYLDEVTHAEYADIMEITDTDIVLTKKPYFPDVKTLTAEQRRQILIHADEFTAFIDAVRKSEREDALQGHIPAAFKLISKLGNRKYKEAFSKEQLRKKLTRLGLQPHDYNNMPEFKSPAQIEKALKSIGVAPDVITKTMDELTYRPDNGYALVPESAKGEPVAPPTLENDFADLFEDDDLLLED